LSTFKAWSESTLSIELNFRAKILCGTHFMAIGLFAGFHDGTCGLKQGDKNQCGYASEHRVQSDFGQLEKGGESALG
jgi:hypothetical protein